LVLLAAALLFNGFALWPELRIGTLPPNDGIFQLAASERLAESLVRGEPFLQPWVSEWSLGYPVWLSYQPLPHLLTGLAVGAVSPWVDAPAAFAAIVFLLLLLWPASVYGGARLLGLGPLGAGLASLLVLLPNEVGDFGRYGLGYGATTWRGSGLYTQLFALHLLVWALGVARRALDLGRGRALTAVLLAATALSHIVFAYVAFVSAGVLALVGPPEERMQRLARLATIVVGALLLVVWFVAPVLLARGEINHSRWEERYKWDSFGAPTVLSALLPLERAGEPDALRGRRAWTPSLRSDLFDAGRGPWLAGLLALGAAVAALSFRGPLQSRMLALAAVWLALFFGRATWGHLVSLAAVPGEFHMHRLQAAFQLSAVLLGARGLELALMRIRRLGVPALLVAVACLGVLVLPPLGAQHAYLEQNRSWGEASLAEFERQRADIDSALASLRAILAERPGRVSAGKAADWGGEFKIGSTPFFAFLSRAHLDQVSFLYHSMSRTSDLMVLRDPGNAAHDRVFGVRAVVAPAARSMPAHLERRARHGDFAVYEASAEGYFSLVDVGARYTGPRGTEYEAGKAWLESALPGQGVVAALGNGPKDVPGFARWELLPAAPASRLSPRGAILSESKQGERYAARIQALRPCHALLKITWSAGLVATVDGEPVELVRVTPGFGALALPEGEHEVVVEYRPGALKPALLGAGLLLFAGWLALLRSGRAAALERAAASRAHALALSIWTPRLQAALLLGLLALVALRPLLRGMLIEGHDATAYPPRVVEFVGALADGHVPPLWSANLSNGHGQPLFQFVPPLLYATAAPFRAAGLGLADALQLALVALFALGVAAVYRIARRLPASRGASAGAAAAWLFAPYLALDLFVRAAFAEAAALAVAPLAVLGLLRLLDRPSPARVAGGALGVALVMLAHNGVALLLLPALALLVVLSGDGGARQRAKTWLVGGLGLGAGLALSAFFWVPALVEKSFVKADLLRADYFDWRIHLVELRQLLWSPWGYGLSGPGTPDGLSFSIGPVHLALGVAGLALGWRALGRTRRGQLAAFGIAALAGAWLATPLSEPLWRHIQTLQYLQFPWRTLFLPALFLPLLAVPALERLPARGRIAVVALLVGINLPHTEPRGYLTFDDEYYASDSIAVRGIYTTSRAEYEPRWVAQRPPFQEEWLRGVDAPLEVRTLSNSTASQEYAVRAERATAVETRTFYYPGWQIRVDEREIAVQPVPERGTMLFDLPAGRHRVTLTLGSTPVRSLANWISLGAGIALLVAGLGGRVGRLRRLEAIDKMSSSSPTPPQ
jgi:hypothetical protein